MWAIDFSRVDIDVTQAYHGSYDEIQVGFSLLLIFIGAYCGLLFLSEKKKTGRSLLRQAFASLLLASGVFSMHFAGMNALILPLNVSFDVTLTVLSFVIIVIATFTTVFLSSHRFPSPKNLMLLNLIFSSGVGCMHYVGMAAMQHDALMVFDLPIVVLSLVAAFGLMGLTQYVIYYRRYKVLPVQAVLLSSAVAAAHYIGMAATYFVPGVCLNPTFGSVMSAESLNIVVYTLSLLLTFSFIFSYASKQYIRILIDQHANLPKQEIAKKFFVFLVPGYLLIVGFLFVTVHFHNMENTSDIRLQDKSDLKVVSYQTQEYLDKALKDMSVLLLSDEIFEYVTTPNAELKLAIEARFQDLMQVSQLYDQIRFIDESGKEKIRVNDNHGNPQPVPDTALQDKSDKNYFNVAFQYLKKGEYRFSSFALNMEYGEIERPYKPVIRVSAPVYGEKGQKRGVLVINLLGERVLSNIRKLDKADGRKAVFLNPDGHYLIGFTKEDDWSLPELTEKKFQTDYENVWNDIKNKNSGQIETKSGIYTYAGIGIKSFTDHGSKIQDCTIVLYSPPFQTTFVEIFNHPFFSITLAFIVLTYTAVCYYIALVLIAKAQDERRINNLLREINFQKKAMDEHAIVSITDVGGKITYVNDKFVEISGYTEEELIGQNHRIIKSGEHSPEFFQELWQTISSGKVWHGEVKNRKKNGEYYWVAASVVPFLNEKGKPFQYVSIRTDITEEKEIALKLEEALKIANSATEAKSNFLANMSHEIRTPMNAIIGLSDLCLKTELTSKQRGYIHKVNVAGNSLLGIINDILDFSKIEAGKLNIEYVPFDLEDVFDNLWTLVENKAFEKKVELLFYRSPEVPYHLVGDPLRLGQILINLVGNAIKFTDAGEVVVEVKMVKHSFDKTMLEFCVKDSGIGLSAEQKSKLFQSFTQADNSTTRKYGGTGLGLTISKQLVNLMGGDIWVESELGQGSRFYFTCEFELGEGKFTRDFFAVNELIGTPVLVVDDNHAANNITTTYLKMFGFEVEAAFSGREAIELMEKNPSLYEAVIIDWHLPDFDGLELIRKTRKDSKIEKQPHFIMVSGIVREEILSEHDAEEIASFIRKPLNPSVLFDAVMETFGHRTKMSHFHRETTQEEGNALTAIQGATLLLVEDNEVNQEIAYELLSDAGFVVDIADNGQKAVEAVQQKTYHGVLMDVQMPIMDGYEATRLIREINEFKNLPIIAMTANAMEHDRQNAFEAGMNDHVAKPINAAHLFEVLLKWVAGPLKETTNKADAEPVVSGVPTFKGINAEEALHRLGGNLGLYQTVLKKFSASQANAFDQIVTAFNEQSVDELARLIHTLKGLAGSIGAKKLHQLLAKMDSLLPSLDDGYMDLLEDTKTEFQGVMTELETYLSEISTQGDQSSGYSQEELNTDLSRLSEMIEQYDMAAEDLIQNIVDKSAMIGFQNELNTLQTQISKFDFDSASKELSKLLEKIDMQTYGRFSKGNK